MLLRIWLVAVEFQLAFFILKRGPLVGMLVGLAHFERCFLDFGCLPVELHVHFHFVVFELLKKFEQPISAFLEIVRLVMVVDILCAGFGDIRAVTLYQLVRSISAR